MQGWKERARLDDVGALLVVGSGKGGVGKSTVSVNLAVALARRGASVGLLDADAYGPSIPMMLGVRKRGAAREAGLFLPLAGPARERRLKPLSRYGVRIMSVGFFIGEEQAVAPIPDVLGVLIRQLLYSVSWGRLDYLIIDLPPGNGEPQATLCREMRIDGAILVTTPQDIARIDTAKALAMFQGVGVPVLGIVRNMDGLECPHCGERVQVFPRSQEARELLDELPLLGSIPLDPAAAVSGDSGQPVVVSRSESRMAGVFTEMAAQVAELLTARSIVSEAQAPRARVAEADSAQEKGPGDERED